MVQHALLRSASRAANSHVRSNSRLLKKIADYAADMSRSNEIARRSRIQKKLAVRRLKKERLQEALQGIARISELGRSKQFQSLIAARGKPIRLWGGSEIRSPGYDMADICWKRVSYIDLTATHIEFQDYGETSNNSGATFRADPFSSAHRYLVPYSEDNLSLWRSHLWSIATPEFREVDDYSVDALFEILIECANSRKFGKIFRNSL